MQRTIPELRRRMFNLCAFIVVLAVMAVMMGVGNHQVNDARQKLQATTQQLRQIGGAP